MKDVYFEKSSMPPVCHKKCTKTNICLSEFFIFFDRVESASLYGNHSSGNFLTHLGDLDWSLSIETDLSESNSQMTQLRLVYLSEIETDLLHL